MTDPLSITGSVAGVISLGIQVTQSLIDFYKSYKDLDLNLAGTTKRLESLSDTFRLLDTTISYRRFQSDEQDLISNIEESINRCGELIQELQDECSKFSNVSSSGIKAAIRVAGRRATYPFRQSTLQKLDEDIDEIRTNLSFALSLLQLKDNMRTEDDLAELKLLLDLVRTNQMSSNLRDWLKAPDATIDHNAACSKKHPGTGAWLMKDAQFVNWLSEENSLLWLNGFAGSGKSVLCSTIIQSVLRYRSSDPRIGIAFFYFTFNDESKQDESAVLRALLLQLSSQLQDDYADLTRLYDSHKTSAPSSRVLLDCLRRLIERFQHVYIVLDGLDESPRDGPRGIILNTLEAMRNWGVQGLHLFITSRDVRDIHESLNVATSRQVPMKNVGIDKDIADFVSARFDTDRELRKWQPYRDKIQTTLIERANGVFRWVDCQFKSLQKCPRSEDHLDCLLSSLPPSLDKTYERMLCNIEPSLIKDARRILTLLCFASRPLTVPELIDGVAMEINDSLRFNRRHKLRDADDIQEICPGFVDIGFGPDHTIETDNEKEAIPTVRIAHYSVQEYLESERIRNQKAGEFALTSTTAHSEIAQICLGYLLEPRLSLSRLDKDILKEYPLARFAARFWFYHLKCSANHTTELNRHVVRLFERKESYINWVKLHDIDEPWRTLVDFRKTWKDIASPVYYISLLGFEKALFDLLDLISTRYSENGKSEANSSRSALEVFQIVNTQGGLYGNALQAASGKGHKEVIQLLLDKGAKINAQGGDYGNALQAASWGGHKEVVRLLLDKRAEINAQGGYYGNALQTASIGGHKEVVQLLLDKGAKINAQSTLYGNALQAASMGGHKEVIRLLLDKGAEINAQGGYYGNALQAASKGGHKEVVRLLLDKGAEINAQGGYYGNALQAASMGGHKEVVRLLLDKGAEINAQGGYYGSALQAASGKGHKEVIQLLLDKGAKINAQGGGYGNTLQAM